ncbi:hypothetical protein X777_09899 [Ooceraea biroi]|uniref:Uncharacterized protein n=1 Tax=Ooceraea biroi TaxID=2015173 RepID=A0A026W572_OOCBI|nr:hypothetical protein X777_09899 [Ooceraea biroi]
MERGKERGDQGIDSKCKFGEEKRGKWMNVSPAALPSILGPSTISVVLSRRVRDCKFVSNSSGQVTSNTTIQAQYECEKFQFYNVVIE